MRDDDVTASPTVTVVTPVLNMKDKLPRCVDSVRSQSYANVEHIVIDGGSSDGTLAFLETASSVRWISEADRGQSDALVKGFAMASGLLLGWLNADDVLVPDALEQTVAAWRAAPGAGLVCGDMELRSSAGSRVDRAPPRISYEVLLERNALQQPATYFSREAYDAVGGLDLGLHYCMDYDLWLRILRAGFPAVRVPHVLAVFEIHPGSKTGGENAARFASEEAIALLKHTELRAAARSLDRWRHDIQARAVVDHLRAGRDHDAREAAASALSARAGASLRSTAFLSVARRSPALARRLLRVRRTIDL